MLYKCRYYEYLLSSDNSLSIPDANQDEIDKFNNENF